MHNERTKKSISSAKHAAVCTAPQDRYLDEVLDLFVDGSLVVVSAHGQTGDLTHEGVVGDTAHHSSRRPFRTARTEERQVLDTSGLIGSAGVGYEKDNAWS